MLLIVEIQVPKTKHIVFQKHISSFFAQILRNSIGSSQSVPSPPSDFQPSVQQRTRATELSQIFSTDGFSLPCLTASRCLASLH